MNTDILSLLPNELQSFIQDLNQPAYRTNQLFDWLHKRGATDFSQMQTLPKPLREMLSEHAYITPCTLAQKQTASSAEKYLFELEAGIFIEAVRMRYTHGDSICISTQVGCRMGCAFCASSEGGLVRNLTAGEMCAQVYAASQSGQRVSSIVMMGCGEPLDNFDASLRFIELITHEKGINIGSRHITLSTCGLIPEMRRLADMKLQITLAVSLHAPSDDIRRTIMPIATQYPIHEILDACHYYAEKTHRRITFEYALIADVNDHAAHAVALAARLKGMLCHVNLIPINNGKGSFSPTPRENALAFAAELEQRRIPVTIRRSLGGEISAACGQLRAKKL